MVNRLNAFHFYENDWESYDTLCNRFEWEVPDKFNMGDYICDRWTTEKPGSVALCYQDDKEEREGEISFQELSNLTNKLANYLREIGVGFGDRVGVNAPQIPETLIAHIAVWKLGAVSVPLSILFGPDALTYRLDDCSAKAVVVDSSNVSAFRESKAELDNLGGVLVIGDESEEEEELFWSAIEESSSELDRVSTDAEDNAVIIYTSGTTGPPKGVLHGHRVLLGNLPLFVTSFCNMEMRENQIHWTPSEWAWVATLFDVLFPTLFYGKSVLAHRGGKFDPERAFELIEKYELTNLFIPPTALRMMMQVDNPRERYETGTVKLITSGGESLGETIPKWAGKTFNAPVHEAYGQTEANLTIGDCTALFEFRGEWIGRPAPGHKVQIMEPGAENPVGRGEVGEIAVKKNPVVFKEYWKKPEKTEEKVVGDWLLTEDLGKMDEEGYVQFKSRKDDVIISSGYRIGPEEIEDTICELDSVVDTGVIGIPDEERGEVPKAFVIPKGKPTENLKKKIKAYVRERLAAYEYPREIEFIDELPKTTTGKIRRKSLRKLEGIE
ncbi:AMP-dependent synthetase [candidate division MSBL1 archaeon SCGC-AAA259E22]|uniref:AMP-dependent synthetase n=1 Tax=candidate division MSBL1 archaeon SCGC-AAA259E22 TaxID=1698265 RepID=A0A133UIL8_9EURY|nr:AMP-dependent synthetase [candidate division MSBL1 archaeon SCGC-AAA259E22]